MNTCTSHSVKGHLYRDFNQLFHTVSRRATVFYWQANLFELKFILKNKNALWWLKSSSQLNLPRTPNETPSHEQWMSEGRLKAGFHQQWSQIQFEFDCAKSHHAVIPEGLLWPGLDPRCRIPDPHTVEPQLSGLGTLVNIPDNRVGRESR